MKWVFFLFLSFLYADPCIVFVHLGPELPPYLSTAVAQARLFNPETPIYVLANEEALQISARELQASRALCIPCETLPKGSLHEKFLKRTKLNRGLWTFATERFFYLADLMHEYHLGDCFHLESDVMLYANVGEMLPTLQRRYARMLAVTFDNDERGIAGIVYVPHLLPLNHLLELMANEAHKSQQNDMVFLSQFKSARYKQYIDTLPILMPEYAEEHPLVSANGRKGAHPEEFINHVAEFNAIFDAAALGQYLGGEYHEKRKGFINESCIFNPSLFQFQWEKDGQGRLIPFAVYKGKRWKINNLHIHCKNLKEFKSK